MTAIETIRNWFKTGSKPTQEQFWAWMDSFWHKSEKIPINQIDGIEQVYNAINETRQMQRIRVIPKGDTLVYKRFSNIAPAIEAGDFVKTIINVPQSDIYIEGVYLGGDTHSITSYDVVNQINFSTVPREGKSQVAI
ncbi:hypothetical protein V3Q90_15775 [Flavobacterium oreochromis]|uniref:hypothetical protein n=1 Tax=Flavobacterium oreochromis TaxID=2906078 RepID=UPI00385EC4D1